VAVDRLRRDAAAAGSLTG